MGTKVLSKQLASEAIALIKKHGSIAAAAKASGIPERTLGHRYHVALGRRQAGKQLAKPAAKVATREDVLTLIKRVPQCTTEELALRLSAPLPNVANFIFELQTLGHNLLNEQSKWSLQTTPAPSEPTALHTYQSDAKGRYRFGFVTDNHLCSKYAREDVLSDLYDWFAEEGITRVYNAGNWIDGEARFNVYDLKVRGMEAQCRYFAEHYPKRDGIETHFIAGNDHEGWYAQREGVDIGKYAERIATEIGRRDLRYLGYMEAFITLQHGRTGASSQMMVVHPGGGSAYAISYTPQKLVESLQGGEKPAIVLIGHYHKMDWFNYRNVWICQGGTTEDQTPFMRSKRLEAHVGGTIIDLRQGERGEINDAIVWMRRYFDRKFYNNRFSLSGPVFNPTVKK